MYAAFISHIQYQIKPISDSFLKRSDYGTGMEIIRISYPVESSREWQLPVQWAAKPGVILADEPTGNLDYQTGQEIMKLICASRELYRQTIVMVTHDMDSANYADRIVYMEDGALR